MFNKNKHQHKWIEVRRYSKEPTTAFKFGGGFWSQEYSDMVYGWTMVELKCQDCGVVRSKKIAYTGP